MTNPVHEEREPWTLLRRPFPFEAVTLTDRRIDPHVGRGAATPVVKPGALLRRLDEAVGVDGWNLSYGGLEGQTVKCRLEILGAVREGFGRHENLLQACAEALLGAARLFGIGLGLHGEATVYVEVDADGAVTNEEDIQSQMRRAGIISSK